MCPNGYEPPYLGHSLTYHLPTWPLQIVPHIDMGVGLGQSQLSTHPWEDSDSNSILLSPTSPIGMNNQRTTSPLCTLCTAFTNSATRRLTPKLTFHHGAPTP